MRALRLPAARGCAERDEPLLPRGLLQPAPVAASELDGSWNMVMFNHSFEHLPEPVQVLRRVARLLSPDGVCVIRIPVAGSYAWRRYREDWVQLDAPRHLFLHTTASLGKAAAAARL